MILNALGALADNPAPLRLAELADPLPASGELLIDVHSCGVCHTELDEIEGRMPPPRLPIVLGHQVVGRVADSGEGTSGSDPVIGSALPGSSPLAELAVSVAEAKRTCANSFVPRVAMSTAAMPS